MPRGRLVTPKDDLEAIRLFTENHIVQFRRGTSVRITEVDHVQFGWMKPERYYQFQKMDDLLPLIGKVIEGGYRFKAAIWGNPIAAMGLMGTAISYYTTHSLADQRMEAAMDIAALFLPFGELWYLYMIARDLPDIAEDLKEDFTSWFEKTGGPLVDWWEEGKGLKETVDTIAGFFEFIFGKGGPISGRPGA